MELERTDNYSTYSNTSVESASYIMLVFIPPHYHSQSFHQRTPGCKGNMSAHLDPKAGCLGLALALVWEDAGRQ